MAVSYGPEAAEEAGQQLISPGGNVYSMADYVKVGVATRGRGVWTTSKRRDQNNPDVDSPKMKPAAALWQPDLEPGEDDGFGDIDPLEAQAKEQTRNAKHVARTAMKQAKELAEAHKRFSGLGKATMVIGGLNVDMLLQDPELLNEDDLLKSAAAIQGMLPLVTNPREQQIIAAYAARVAGSLRQVLQAKEQLAKAIVTDKPEKKDAKPARPPSKASEKKADGKGKTQYKYQKKGNGKGPNSDGAPGTQKTPPNGQGQEGAQPAPGQPNDPTQVSPPPPVDVDSFAGILGLASKQLEKFAAKHTKQDFVSFWMRQGDGKLAQKHGLQPAFLGSLYDQLVAPAPQAGQQKAGAQGLPPPQKEAGAAPPQPQDQTPQMGKALVLYTGATQDAKTLALLDLLKSHGANTVEDVRLVLRDHYAVTDTDSYQLTRAALRQWEHSGLVSIQPQR